MNYEPFLFLPPYVDFRDPNQTPPRASKETLHRVLDEQRLRKWRETRSKN